MIEMRLPQFVEMEMKLPGFIETMTVFCNQCHKMAPFRCDDTEMICDWCGFKAPIEWTRKFGLVPKGTIPVRQEHPID